MTSGDPRFVWYELMTDDPDAATQFYAEVVGWTVTDAGMPDMAYSIFATDAGPVGGLMAIPDEASAAGAEPVWFGYVGVDDVDAMASRIEAAGGRVHRAPDDIPGVGRFAMVSDPHGAAFAVFSPADGGDPPPPAPPGTPGQAGWRELMADDLDTAFAFYAAMFGWTRAEAHDMGPAGVYQLFAAGGETIGGMMTRMPDMPSAFWTYYFNVADIDAAAARVTAAGGKVVNGPMEVPGGSRILQGLDPQGAMFALVAPAAG